MSTPQRRPSRTNRPARPETPNKNRARTAPKSPAGQTTVFRPERTNLLAIVLLTAIAVLIISWKPLVLGWLLIIPALALWWVLRARTTVSEDGIAIRYGFRSGVHLPWEDFAGIGFKWAHAFAATRQGKKFNLPGVTFNSLPDLARASRGRIPDALSAGKKAADDKVVVIHRDGQQVLMSKEEYAAYQATEGDSATHTDSNPN